MLIFGNPELTHEILSHLPNANGQIQEESNVLETDRVMIVDDEPFNLDSLKIVLQCATIQVQNFSFKNRVDLATNGL